FCGLGSVKSNIGHLRYAAGVPGLMKAALAISNKVLPPTANLKNVNPRLGLDDSPFYILSEKKPWHEVKAHPRRANVSAYGFGGADYHIAMEEFRPEFLKNSYFFPKKNDSLNLSTSDEVSLGNKEIVFFSGASPQELNMAYSSFKESLGESEDFEKAVFVHNSNVTARSEWRVAIYAGDIGEIDEKWELLRQFISEDSDKRLEVLNHKGIYIGKGEKATRDTIAWMFPGQASQYPNMLKELFENYPVVEALYLKADAVWNRKYGSNITQLVFGTDEAALEERLKDTKNTHPAVFLSDMAMFKLLSESGLTADYMVGHSLGEIAAIYASGMLDMNSCLELLGSRGFSFDGIKEENRGRMVSINTTVENVEDIIRNNNLDICISNINSPVQTVVGGRSSELDRLEELLNKCGMTYIRLKVSHAFHTELMLSAAGEFYQKIKDIQFSLPNAKVMACHRGDFYPDTRDGLGEMSSLLREQILTSVNFSKAIMKLYDSGVRIFVECGPSSILTKLVKNILPDKGVKVIAANHKSKNPVEAYKLALAELFASGIDVCPVPSGRMLGLPQKILKEEKCVNINEGLRHKINTERLSGEMYSRKESLVYSGVSMGLPGSYKKVFSDENLRLVFEGNNLIERLTDDEIQSMAELNITRLVKVEGATTFKRLSSINDVIQLAAKFGNIDMLNDYLVDEKTLKEMTITWCAGVAAGYEALKDAGIPLVKEVMKTSTGASLPGRFVLPREMREDTGVIFANGFLSIEPFITEASKFIAYKLGGKARNELVDFYESVIAKVSDLSVRKILSDWFNLHYSRLVLSDNENSVYEFNKDFMAQISSRANNRLAQFIGAMGPNFHISAACSSTASAVTIAEDLIRGGHAGRVIVVGAENPTSKTALPWIGASFLGMGAATNVSDVFEAAIPFDNRRSGMIIGAGAVGLVIEKENDVKARGMNGICRILGTHVFNTAGHQTKVDSTRHSIELDKFISKMEKEYGFRREGIVKKTVYYSHETYTSKKGGCSYTEKIALEDAFGEAFRELKIVNTKGITGHTMGASVEEAISAKALQYQRIPPVVNFKVPDPELDGLNLSRGGAYDFDYLLRMVSGYGGQGNYHLLQKLAAGDDRIVDGRVYQKWLEEITASKDVVLNNYGRILVAEKRDKTDLINMSNSVIKKTFEEVSAASLKKDAALSEIDIMEEVLKVYSDITKYPKEMLDLSMEIEADLGIDTVKQATIISIIMEKFNIIGTSALNMYELKTIKHVVDAVIEKQGAFCGSKAGEEEKDEFDLEAPITDDPNEKNTYYLGRAEDLISDREIEYPAETIGARPGEKAYGIDIVKSDKPEDIELAVTEIFAEITGYPVEMLEKDMEIEADLGIDTVKQATILSLVSDRFSLPFGAVTNMSQHKTIGEIVAFVIESVSSKTLYYEDTDTDNGGLRVTDDQEVKDNESQQTERELCLQIPVFVEEKLPCKDYDLRDKIVLVIGDCPDTVHKVFEYFKLISGKVSELILPKGQEPDCPDDIIFPYLESGLEVIVDCSHVGRKVEFDKLTQSEEKLLLQESKSRFVFYKKLFERMPAKKLRIICMVSMDGYFGHGLREAAKKVTDPFCGAVCGFYKGLRKELEGSLVKIVDLGLEKAEVSEKELIILKEELESMYTDYEIGYSDGKRKVLQIDYLDRSALEKIELPYDSHFVVTGGGFGITSEIVRELSLVYKGKFTIIGRTRIPENIKELSALGEDGIKGKRHEIQEALKKDGKKVTPALVQEELDKLIKAVSVYKLVEEIEGSGCRVSYVSCDVTDYESLKEALNESVESFGPVNVLIHGAGIEKSRLIAQKSPE
ncbi:MAG: SDR family NAD(P)-dependent oxidoreductase, partial [Clostridiaceae bacterium]|nr:SDR family NAD(P)-dependent oxidoreductase [Clostridiaceae bacterium]